MSGFLLYYHNLIIKITLNSKNVSSLYAFKLPLIKDKNNAKQMLRAVKYYPVKR